MDLGPVFSKIYRDYAWGWPSKDRRNLIFYSGGGTEPENDIGGKYVKLLQSFVSKPDVVTVVEVGCGDFEVGSLINWDDTLYTGYDVVPELIEYNNKRFSSENVRFVCGDALKMDLKADLLIVKDVFQHLPYSCNKDFVRAIPQRFKYNLITNDYGGKNTDMEPGGYGGDDFSMPPYNMHVDLLIQWRQKSYAAGNKQTVTLSDRKPHA